MLIAYNVKLTRKKILTDFFLVSLVFKDGFKQCMNM